MSKRIRNWLFIAFIVCFVIGTTLVSLYASGYKINFGWPLQTGRFLIRTGMIIVDSRPAGATVYLDGEVQKVFSLSPLSDENVTTAAKLRNIPPGEYLLRLERDGYWPWEKKIRVNPNQATTLADVNLFRSDGAQLVTNSPEGGIELSPTGRFLYVDGNHRIISLRTGQTEAEITAGTTAAWRRDVDELVAGTQFISPQGRTTDYRSLVGTGTVSVYDEPANRLYYLKDGSLGYLNIPSQTASLLLSQQNIQAYQPVGDRLWLIISENGRAMLKSYPLAGGPLKTELELPGIGEYGFRADGGPRLSLYDRLNRTLYLIDTENPAGNLVTVKDALSWQWVNANTLLYNNSWEIFRLDLDNRSTTLLTRVGEELRTILWHGDRNYLIFSTADSLQVYDPRLETITRIFQAKKLSAPVLDADDDTLYFWADSGDQAGAYRLLLQ